MQIQCGDQIRAVRSRILDQDMFAPAPNTPEHTSWTTQLLQHLDGAFESNAIDQPIFPTLENDKPRQKGLDSSTLREVRDGKYDSLFNEGPDKVSDLYRAAQIVPSPPIAHLIGALAVKPYVFSQPQYPMIAQMVRVEGEVTFDFDIDPNGLPTNLRNDVGPVILKGAVVSAIKSWKFPKDSSGQEIKATFEFILTCKPTGHR